MKRPLRAGGTLLWLAAFAGTAEEADPARSATAATAAEPRPREELLVDGDWLVGRLEDPEVVVLHVGAERGEYEQGHVPGARFLPVQAIGLHPGAAVGDHSIAGIHARRAEPRLRPGRP